MLYNNANTSFDFHCYTWFFDMSANLYDPIVSVMIFVQKMMSIETKSSNTTQGIPWSFGCS